MVTTALKSYSFEDYCCYDDNTDNRYELVDGQLEIMTPPSFRHLLIADKLRAILSEAIAIEKCPSFCLPEMGVRTGWRKSRIVDLVVVSRSQVLESLEQSAISEIPPLLAIEIVSPESIQKDYRYKRSEYAALEIPEYWIETAYDYHEFKSIVYRLNKIGINRKIKYVELGFYNGVYNAVFWIGKNQQISS
jgi:Uma2 family endonuclease